MRMRKEFLRVLNRGLIKKEKKIKHSEVKKCKSFCFTKHETNVRGAKYIYIYKEKEEEKKLK